MCSGSKLSKAYASPCNFTVGLLIFFGTSYCGFKIKKEIEGPLFADYTHNNDHNVSNKCAYV